MTPMEATPTGATKGRFYRANAWGPANGVGAIFAVLALAAVFRMNSPGDGRPAPLAGLPPFERALIDVAILGPFLLMSLVQCHVDLDAEARQGRVGRGVWPFLRWRPVSLAGPAELRLTGAQDARGWKLHAALVLSEGDRKIPLTTAGGSLQLEEILPFARRLGARIVVSPGLRRVEAVRRLVPEAFADGA